MTSVVHSCRVRGVTEEPSAKGGTLRRGRKNRPGREESLWCLVGKVLVWVGLLSEDKGRGGRLVNIVTLSLHWVHCPQSHLLLYSTL